MGLFCSAKTVFNTLTVMFCHADATKITLAPSNADINQGENVTLQCHASHDPTMDLTFTWALNGVLLDLEDSAGLYHRVEGVSWSKDTRAYNLDSWEKPV